MRTTYNPDEIRLGFGLIPGHIGPCAAYTV